MNTASKLKNITAVLIMVLAVLKALLLCTIEITALRFVMAWVRATAFIGYRKKKLQWGRIERQKIDLK